MLRVINIIIKFFYHKEKKCTHNYITLPFFKGHECSKCGDFKEFNMKPFKYRTNISIMSAINKFKYDSDQFVIEFGSLNELEKKEILIAIRNIVYKNAFKND